MTENEKFSADELLRLFLTTPFEAESAKFFDLLMKNFALPTVKKILREKIGSWRTASEMSAVNYEDLYNESCLKITGVLRSRKINRNAPPIEDFPAYCAKIVYNVWNSFVREHSPNRESLKNKIRYALDKDERFSRTTMDGENFYYLRARNFNVSPIAAEAVIGLIKKESENFAPVKLIDLMVLIFETANGGWRIEELLKIAADIWQVRDFPDLSLEIFPENFETANLSVENYEMRYKLEYLWREILELPVLQRTALLYHLRDENGGEMIFSFFNTRLATLEEIAGAMNLTKPELIELVPHLPFDDKKIAGAMNLTVKQIGNLRKSARDSLRRRLEGKAKRQRSNSPPENYQFIVDENKDLTIKSDYLN